MPDLCDVGRRVISTYLLLFLHHATTRLSTSSSSHILSPSSSQFDFDAINYRATYTAVIGEHVGRAWNLQRSMLWTPPVSLAYSNSPLSAEDRFGSKAPGLFKVQGTTVEAIMGGIYHQFVRFSSISCSSLSCTFSLDNILFTPFASYVVYSADFNNLFYLGRPCNPTSFPHPLPSSYPLPRRALRSSRRLPWRCSGDDGTHGRPKLLLLFKK